MRILLTGASSFTGSWFAAGLARAGHEVTAAFRGTAESYEGQRSNRVNALKGIVEPRWGVSFGDERFLDIVSTQAFDLLCHHGAEMTGYRSWDFDPLAATMSNTRSARAVLEALQSKGGWGVLLTGSVFEPFEGVGDSRQRAFNPYGLSKHLSFEVFRMEAERLGLGLGKFVIPNPFGPHEEFRFTSFLAREWFAGRTPKVATPDYVRDNIHVSLLTASYTSFVGGFPKSPDPIRIAPSGYIESQGAFAQRMARELERRLGRPCPVECAAQADFSEPLIRVNQCLTFRAHPEWSEEKAWDDLADYYRVTFS